MRTTTGSTLGIDCAPPVAATRVTRASDTGVRTASGVRVTAAPFLFAVALFLSPAPAAAQTGLCEPGFDWGAGPAFLDNTEGESRLGAELSARLCSSGHDLRRPGGGDLEFTPPEPFPYSWDLAADTRFSLIADGELVPLQNHVGGRGGISISLSKPAEPFVCPDDMPDDECARRMAEIGATEYDFGFVFLSGRARYESDLGFSEQQVVGGAELRYGHLRGYVPSVVVAYDVVKPLTSDVREAASVSDAKHWRWTAEGYLYHQVERIMGELRAGVFRANGLAPALDALGWDDGEYLEGTLSVVTDWEVWGVFTVDRIWGRLSDGRMSSVTGAGESLGIGVELGL